MSRTPNSNSISINLFITLSFFVLASYSNVVVDASPTNLNNGSNLRGMFIFGSSIVDNGNNNNLFGNFAKANYLPYGIDLALGPTGRFSNGKNVADLIADHLKLPLVPPFCDPNTKGKSIVHGVNFGSGGSGILDVTGVLLGVTSMNNQIKNFKNKILPQLETEIGRKAHKVLPEYLFLVGAGNNDYSSYYLLHENIIWTPEVFAAKLISNLFAQLKELYDLGARKFLLLSVYPVGCNPVLAKNKKNCVKELNAAVNLYYDQLLVMVKHKNDQHMPAAQFSIVNSAKIINGMIQNANASVGCNPVLAKNKKNCVKELNAAVNLYYDQLLVMVKHKNDQHMPAAQFSVVNSAKIINGMIQNANASGFTNVDFTCCDTSMLGGLCKKKGKVCPKRNEYVYFDGLHLTEAANAILATKAYNSIDSSEVFPVNLEKLVQF